MGYRKRKIICSINSLAEALQKRYDDVEEAGSDRAYWLLADLNTRYGGAYDPKIIAMFLVESQKPIMPNTRFESWSGDWENLQKRWVTIFSSTQSIY